MYFKRKNDFWYNILRKARSDFKIINLDVYEKKYSKVSPSCWDNFPALYLQTAAGCCGANVRTMTRINPPPSSRGPGGNPGSSSLRLRCLNWRGASSSSGTSLPRRGSTWPAPWSSPPPRSRSGSKTGGTNVRDSGKTRAWRWQVTTTTTITTRRRPGGWLCRCWSGTGGLVCLDPRTITLLTQLGLQTRTATTAIRPTATTARCTPTPTPVLTLVYPLCLPAAPLLLMRLWTWI